MKKHSPEQVHGDVPEERGAHLRGEPHNVVEVEDSNTPGEISCEYVPGRRIRRVPCPKGTEEKFVCTRPAVYGQLRRVCVAHVRYASEPVLCGSRLLTPRILESAAPVKVVTL